MEVELVKPYGFCKGVVDAIKMAKEAKIYYKDEEITILGMLVHNKDVIEQLSSLGIRTINDDSKSLSELLSTIKKGVVIFTAHGHDPKLEEQATNQGLKWIDATCKYVTFNHQNILTAIENGFEIIYIGKIGHLETVATLSLSNNIYLYDVKKGLQNTPKTDKIKIFNQTTLSLLDIKDIYQEILSKYPNAIIGDEICMATRKRQEAILNNDKNYELIIIVGDSKSNNTLSLFNIAKDKFKDSKIIRVNNLEDLLSYDISSYKTSYVLTGTSTPKELVDEILKYLKTI